jgi:hypothetical protein
MFSPATLEIGWFKMQRHSPGLSRILKGWMLVGLVNILCQQSVGAQDAIADDKAKRADDKQTLTEDLKALASCQQTLSQYDQEMADERAAIQAAQAKKQGDPALTKLIKDEQAKFAVTQAYAQQYRDYLRRMQERVARDRSILQQDSIDMAADDASTKLAQEEAMRAALDPRYGPYGVPVGGAPENGVGNPYGNPGYVDPYLGGGANYYPPNYGYGYGQPWGYGGANGAGGSHGSNGGAASPGGVVNVGGGRR